MPPCNCGTQVSNVFYFGLQTNVQGNGKGVLYSRWGTMDLSNAMVAPDLPANEAWSTASTTEGGFIGVRRLIDWGTGKIVLTFRSMPEKDDAVGRWFGIWITTPAVKNAFCGALRFPKDTTGAYPLLMLNGAGSFVENYSADSSALDVPYWAFSIDSVTADGVLPWLVRYYYANNQQAYANSNIQPSPDGFPIQVSVGANVLRTSPPTY
jgi:hypothetical protein